MRDFHRSNPAQGEHICTDLSTFHLLFSAESHPADISTSAGKMTSFATSNRAGIPTSADKTASVKFPATKVGREVTNAQIQDRIHVLPGDSASRLRGRLRSRDGNHSWRGVSDPRSRRRRCRRHHERYRDIQHGDGASLDHHLNLYAGGPGWSCSRRSRFVHWPGCHVYAGCQSGKRNHLHGNGHQWGREPRRR